ncbi:oxalate:formate antiporter [Vibrio sp. SM6]|uniref:Oxalate:formate antiporter n=1 Tax=Vibrio agarilyticus TaxID=2726741 RepID=A0A7X8YFJ7_9VIBR|nr:nucleotidyltransferase domain-containing protein [Vibrio agarilyticus]NLS11993.1 oxalate:formate antiporter [Vibrio agarilyticus]
MKFPSTLPTPHRTLLETIITRFSADPRIAGIAASGSYTTNTMDIYSDLDLVIACAASDYASVMHERFALIEQLDGGVAAFSGEHVGEPRLVIALFAPKWADEPIHVDFKFVALEDAAQRVDPCQVLWEREGELSQIYASSTPYYPQPEPQWIEERFWTWVHYGATKIARGEYFEAVEFLSFLRTTVLSPLALRQSQQTPSGVRKLETRLPEFALELGKTVVKPEKLSLIDALNRVITLYLRLRENEVVIKREAAQQVSMDYVARLLN